MMNEVAKTNLLAMKLIIANQRLLLKKAYGLSENPDEDTTAAEIALSNSSKMCDVITNVIQIHENGVR